MSFTYSDPLFLGTPPAGFTAQEFNKVGEFIGLAGVANAGDLVPSNGGGVTVNFTAGRAIIPGTTNPGVQGNYLCRVTGTPTVTLSSAPAVGRERTDYIVAKVYDDPIEVVAGGTNQWQLVAVAGTDSAAGASQWPSGPSIAGVSSCIPICTVKVGSGGIIAITDQRKIGYHPSTVDSAGNKRYMDMGSTPKVNETVYGQKQFHDGIGRGTGAVRGTNRLKAHLSAGWSLPSTNYYTGNWTPFNFNAVDELVSDNELAYAAGVVTINGSYAINAIVTLAAPNGYAGARIVTGGGSIIAQNKPAAPIDPFAPGGIVTLSLSALLVDYNGTFHVEVIQQSSGAQGQFASVGDKPSTLSVIDLG